MKRQKYVMLEEEEVSLPMQKVFSPKIEKSLEAQVQDGDTLASIALRFHCTVAEIKRLNKIDKDNEIYARKIIKVPITPHSILLETLPNDGSDPNTPLYKEAEGFFNNNDVDSLREEAIKLNEKLFDPATTDDPSQKTINAIVLNSRLRRNLYSENLNENDRLRNSFHDNFEEHLPQPRMIPGPTNVLFDCSGSDCDMSWVCLFVFILALCFAIPLIYIVYIAEHYEKFHHNSTTL